MFKFLDEFPRGGENISNNEPKKSFRSIIGLREPKKYNLEHSTSL